MANLFIIGNGFDIAHNLKTSYNDFYNYLKKKFPDADENRIILPTGNMMPDGGIEYNEVETVSLLLFLISDAENWGDKWSDVENSLGNFNFSYCFDDLPEFFDKEGDRDYQYEYYNNEDRSSHLVTPILEITDHFSDWISLIYTYPKQDFKKLIDNKNDLFLTFNYTLTLENLYDAKNVCHIHGRQCEKILFGHGNYKDFHSQDSIPIFRCRKQRSTYS
ncbi:MAG: hypothetical protein HGA49_10720 [Eubacteriaceae bacterium]|nr:hypothetical protein [Eubacteriaceae bacterium]